ncbi:ATP synthase F1 subunit gamma [Paraburkholderia bryophila]|uniref:ATP synthase F1 subunit gamma n=1 Tax=Burkholderiaceae TaxID=119060 RepID=UPI000551E9C2|nr:ATP synthase F1 subunit gamma [Burkholderia sp. 9120]
MHIREIRSKIRSVSATRKITRAMEMMARTRMANAQRRARTFRPYAERIREIALRLREDSPDYVSPLFVKRARIARVGLIVVSTDRGLCGPLNSRLLMRCAESLNDWQRGGMEAEVIVIGARGAGPLMRHGAHIVARTAALSADLHFESFFGAVSVPLSGFLAGHLDEVYVAYNHLSSALSYEPRIDRILPLGEMRREGEEVEHAGAVRTEYLYEPSPKPVVDALLLRYVEALIYQAVAENNACEQCARMFAMQTATENADRVIRDLRHLYQKTRQAQITTELCEIVGGAAAV